MDPLREHPIGPVRALLLMARPSQVALVVLVYAAGVLLGVWRGSTSGHGTGAAGLGLLLLLPVTIAVHWANEAADAATDARSVRTQFSGGSGGLAASGLAPAVPLRLALGLGGVAAVATIMAAAADLLAVPAMVLVLVGLFGGLAYSLPPAEAMRRGLGEPLNALLGGLVLPLYGVAVLRGRVDAADVVAFLPFTLVVLCSVLATAWPDREADAATGKWTLQVRWPPPRLRRFHGAIALGWLAATGLTMVTDALPFAAAGLLVAPLLALAHAWYTTDRSPWPSVAAMVGLISIVTVSLLVTVA